MGRADGGSAAVGSAGMPGRWAVAPIGPGATMLHNGGVRRFLKAAALWTLGMPPSLEIRFRETPAASAPVRRLEEKHA
ncbi:hypothetical protein GCM10022377_15250 [Zhihengliuella alba]|uniref:Uncharacterized protein n=1 Tax=Zhihengliuella alba TaxID=547018 RepID=A0ABP7DCZ6_9MICC